MRLLLLASISFATSLSVSADPLLEQMRSLTSEGSKYAYEMAFETDEYQTRLKIDPSEVEGQRIDVIAPDESEWTDDFRKYINRMDANTEGEIWCQQFAEMVPQDAKATEQSTSSIAYAFTPVPEADADKSEQKLMKQMDGTVRLDKSDGAVLSFSMSLPKPFKPMIAAKIDQFEMQVDCARAPDGRTFIQRMNLDITGSAMMQKIKQIEKREITRLLGPVG